jgi:hypothetical protein
MSTAAVFLDIEKALDTAWHSGLLHKLFKLEFSTIMIGFVSSLLSNGKLEFRLKSRRLRPREYKQVHHKVSFCTFFCRGLYLALYAGNTCVHATDRKEGYVLRNLQGCLTSMVSRFERWNNKINEDRPKSSISLIDLQRSRLILH